MENGINVAAKHSFSIVSLMLQVKFNIALVF